MHEPAAGATQPASRDGREASQRLTFTEAKDAVREWMTSRSRKSTNRMLSAKLFAASSLSIIPWTSD